MLIHTALYCLIHIYCFMLPYPYTTQPTQLYAALYCLFLPYAALPTINILLPESCCPVLFCTALNCLIIKSHWPSKKMLKCCLYCFLLPYAAIPSYHTILSIIMLPHASSYCPMLPYPYIKLTLQEHAASCCLEVSLLPYAAFPTFNTVPPRVIRPHTASYFLMLPYSHITLSFPETHSPVVLRVWQDQ